MGAVIGAALGAQDGGDGVALGERWYYHYDDLGSVVATTDAAGAQVGVYVPDHWGNYRLVIGTRPDTMGLTGKFFDADAGLYYFNARWYDPERGHWMNKDPGGMLDGVNVYAFCINDAINGLDVNGYETEVLTRTVYEDHVGCGEFAEREFYQNECSARCNRVCASRGGAIGSDLTCIWKNAIKIEQIRKFWKVKRIGKWKIPLSGWQTVSRSHPNLTGHPFVTCNCTCRDMWGNGLWPTLKNSRNRGCKTYPGGTEWPEDPFYDGELGDIFEN